MLTGSGVCVWGTWVVLQFPQGVLAHNGWGGFWVDGDTAWAVAGVDLIPPLLAGTHPLFLLSLDWIPLPRTSPETTLWIRPTSQETLRWVQRHDTLLVEGGGYRLLRFPGGIQVGDGSPVAVRTCPDTVSRLFARWIRTPVQGVLRWWPMSSPSGILGWIHRLYKGLLSRQQGDLCNFRPTCSTYAVQRMQREGIWGWLAAADRLLRDHPRVMHREDTYPFVRDEFLRLKRLDLPPSSLPSPPPDLSAVLTRLMLRDTSLIWRDLLTVGAFLEHVHPLAAPAAYAVAAHRAPPGLDARLSRYTHTYATNLLQSSHPPTRSARRGWLRALAVIPGVGYALCGHPEEAWHTWRLLGWLSIGMGASLHARRPATAWVYGLSMAWIAGGSVYGGVRCLTPSPGPPSPKVAPLPISTSRFSLAERADHAVRTRQLQRAYFFARLDLALNPDTARWRTFCGIAVLAGDPPGQMACEREVRSLVHSLRRGPPSGIRWLNRVVPGTGIIALGAWRDGTLSLVLNALVGWGLWTLTREKRWVDAFLLGAFLGERFWRGSQALLEETYRFRTVTRWMERPSP